MPTPDEPTIPVLRAPERLLRDALEEIAKLYSEAKRAGVIARDALAAYDAAVARPAEPGRCKALSPTAGVVEPLHCTRQQGHLGEHVWDYAAKGGVVGGDA
jgi:hypothetical protein